MKNDNFEKFFNSIEDMIFVANESGKIFHVNKAATKLLGYTYEEFINLSIDDLHPSFLAEEAEKIHKEISENKREYCPLPYIRKDGSIIPVETKNWEGVWDNKPCRFFRVKNLSKEVELLERFQSLFDNNSALLSVTSMQDYTITEANKMFLEVLGFKKNEVIGKKTKDLGIYFQKGILRSFDEELSNTNKIESRELEIKKKDGTIIEGLFSANIINTQGKKEILTVFVDMTRVKEAEKKLVKQRTFYEQIINAIPDYIFYKDLKGKYIGANKAVLDEVFGKNIEDIIGKTDCEISKHKEHTKKYKENDLLTIKTESRIIAEEKLEKNNGEIIDIETIKTPFYDEKGNLKGLIGISRNISLRKEYQDILVKAKEEAEVANKAKNRFLANMSHEIRTPMNGILGFLQLIETTNLTKEQWEYINNIKMSSNLLQGIINDILDFSKMESIGLELMNEDINLHKTIEDALVPFTAIAEERGVDMFLYIAKEVPLYIKSDALRLKQIITNLLGNAVKFTEKGYCYLSVNTEKIDENNFLVIKVEDTGIGIEENYFNHLFDAFHQGDETISKKYGGTGLGLPITKDIVETMGGYLEFHSIKNKGSVFVAKILYKEAKDTKLLENENENLSYNYNKECLKDICIVLIDDDEKNTSIITSYIREAKGNVISFKDAKEFIKKHKENKNEYSVILISARIIDKEFVNSINMPMVIIAFRGDKKIRQELEIEASEYIYSPIRRHSLYRKIMDVVNNKNIEDMMNTSYEAKKETSVNNKKQKILIVDDNKINNELLTKALEKDYELVLFYSGKKALEYFKEDIPDLVLLDIMMPDLNGYDLLKEMKKDVETKDIPVIFLTAMSDTKYEEYGLELGAIDYITKPYSIPIIKTKIRNHLISLKNLEELKIDSFEDSLTKISNRRMFEKEFEKVVLDSKENKYSISVLMIDIDYFKKFNDTYGHLEGDEILFKVAQTLVKVMKRKEDFVARWGGEEFIGLLKNLDPKEASLMGEKVRDSIEKLMIAHKSSDLVNESGERFLTVSVGVATLDGDKDINYENIVEQADKALYMAKKSGRNKVISYNLCDKEM